MIKCCYKCEDRQMGCHASCQRYKAEKADLDAQNAELREKRKIRHDLDCARIRAIKRIKYEGRKR